MNATAARRLVVEHWGEAEGMGSIAGTVAAGGRAAWAEVPGFWSEIGTHTLKYAAWGDGYDETVPVPDRDGAFTVWYGRDDRVVVRSARARRTPCATLVRTRRPHR